MDIAKKPSLTSQLSVIQLPITPKLTDPPKLSAKLPQPVTNSPQLPPPIRTFAATPAENKDAVLGKLPSETTSQEKTTRQTSITKVKVEPIRIPKRLPSSSSISDLPKGSHGNKPHPSPNALSLKKARSNTDMASHPLTPLTAKRKKRTSSQSKSSRCGSETDLVNPGQLSSSSEGEVCMCVCMCAF